LKGKTEEYLAALSGDCFREHIKELGNYMFKYNKYLKILERSKKNKGAENLLHKSNISSIFREPTLIGGNYIELFQKIKKYMPVLSLKGEELLENTEKQLKAAIYLINIISTADKA